MRLTFAKVLVGVPVLALIIAQSAAPVGAATASTAPSGNGLKVSPVTTNITINPGESQTVKIYVQNVTSATATFQGYFNDFTASTDENGTPALLLDPNQYAPTHSLKRYVAPIGSVTLNPGEQKSVDVTINIPSDAAGGGYYGAVRFAPATLGNQQNINLVASVASLILVRVPGAVTDDLRLDSLDVRNDVNAGSQLFFTSNKGLMAVARFENKGNVQEQPFGKVLLMQGSKELAEYEINPGTPRGNVLPNSIRRFTANLDKVGMFGKYTVEGNFGYGTNGQLLTGKTTFYVIPLMLLVVVGIILVIAIALIVLFPRMISRYNRMVIQRARRR